eukprot:1042454-Pelagomonas_calceolata.AAC.4
MHEYRSGPPLSLSCDFIFVAFFLDGSLQDGTAMHAAISPRSPVSHAQRSLAPASMRPAAHRPLTKEEAMQQRTRAADKGCKNTSCGQLHQEVPHPGVPPKRSLCSTYCSTHLSFAQCRALNNRASAVCSHKHTH